MTTSGDDATALCSARPLRSVSGIRRYFQGNVVALSGLVQQPVQIAAALRLRDLTLIVR